MRTLIRHADRLLIAVMLLALAVFLATKVVAQPPPADAADLVHAGELNEICQQH